MCGKYLITPFYPRGGPVKHVEACLSARDNRESNFHRCGSPLRWVQAFLCAGNPDKAVFTSEEVL